MGNNIGKLLRLSYWCFNRRLYNEMLSYDIRLYNKWSGKFGDRLSWDDKSKPEWKYICCLRAVQANSSNIWGRIFRLRLRYLTKKTGIWIPDTVKCGKGLIIGHWGRIIVNPQTIIGDDFSISSGVVIGRDIRGKRAGVPRIGNRVVLKTNAAVIGNVEIGNDVLIAPNAFVNFDVPDHSIVIGNPGQIHHRENATEGYI